MSRHSYRTLPKDQLEFPINANLHLVLSVSGCSYFEHPVPVEHYEYACANPIRIEADGCVSAPDGPGLGLDLDWKKIERDASLAIDTDTMS